MEKRSRMAGYQREELLGRLVIGEGSTGRQPFLRLDRIAERTRLAKEVLRHHFKHPHHAEKSVAAGQDRA